MDIARTARTIYSAIKSDPAAIATYRRRLTELACDVGDPDKQLELTNFTINGQSGGGSVRLNKLELLTLHRLVICMVDNGGALSTRTVRQRF